MNTSIRASLCVVSLLLSGATLAKESHASVHPDADTSGTAQDIADVQSVMGAFHEAVITHDGTRLAALFIPEGSTWLNVLTADAYEHAKSKSPDAPKVRLGSCHDFAKLVSNTQSALDPKHSHIQIKSEFDVILKDGSQARVSRTYRAALERRLGQPL